MKRLLCSVIPFAFTLCVSAQTNQVITGRLIAQPPPDTANLTAPAQPQPPQPIPSLVDRAVFDWVASGQQLTKAACTKCHTDSPAVQGNLLIQNYDHSEGTRQVDLSIAGSLVEPDDTTRALLGIEKGTGLIVSAVCSSKAGNVLGLKAHDVILSVNDTSIQNHNQLTAALAKETESTEVAILRKGKQETLTLVRKPKVTRRYLIGVRLGELESVVTSQLGLDDHVKVVILEVQEDSAALAAGMKVNDIVLSIEGEAASTAQDIQKVVGDSNGKQLELQLLRERKPVIVTVTPTLTEIPVATDSRLHVVPNNYYELYRDLAHPNYSYQFTPKAYSVPQPTDEITRKMNEIEKKIDQLNRILEQLERQQK